MSPVCCVVFFVQYLTQINCPIGTQSQASTAGSTKRLLWGTSLLCPSATFTPFHCPCPQCVVVCCLLHAVADRDQLPKGNPTQNSTAGSSKKLCCGTNSLLGLSASINPPPTLCTLQKHKTYLSLMTSTCMIASFSVPRVPKECNHPSTDRLWTPIPYYLISGRSSQLHRLVWRLCCSCLKMQIILTWLPVPFTNSTLTRNPQYMHQSSLATDRWNVICHARRWEWRRGTLLTVKSSFTRRSCCWSCLALAWHRGVRHLPDDELSLSRRLICVGWCCLNVFVEQALCRTRKRELRSQLLLVSLDWLPIALLLACVAVPFCAGVSGSIALHPVFIE